MTLPRWWLRRSSRLHAPSSAAQTGIWVVAGLAVAFVVALWQDEREERRASDLWDFWHEG